MTNLKDTNLILSVDNDPNFFTLYEPLELKVNGLDPIKVRKGFRTNLASIPRPLLMIFNRNGKSRKAAVIHDWLYTERWETRKQCDDLFYKCLVDCGMWKWQAKIYWFGVRIGGWTRGRW